MMDLSAAVPRRRTDAEAAFALLRVLLRGHVLWAAGGGLTLDALPGLVDAPSPILRAAVERLLAEGVVSLHAPTCTLRLSDATLCELRAATTLH
jgi:hypothetical protein